MAEHLLLDRKDRDKLGIVHEKFMKGEVTSFVCIAVYADGTTEVNYDLVDAQNDKLLNKMGGGLMAAFDQIRNMALELKIKNDPLRLLRAKPN